MPLHAPTKRRERILVYGEWGSGKSYAWVKLAEWMLKTGVQGRVHLLDMDFAYSAQAAAFEGFEDVVTEHPVMEWPQMDMQMKAIRAASGPEDVLAIDHADTPWTMVQDYYTEQTQGKDAADFFLEFKRAKGQGNPLSDAYGSNWQTINKLYNGHFINHVLNFPGHVICTAKADQIRTPNAQGKGGDDSETIKNFGRVGWKPKGQSALPYQMLTVLLMQNVRPGDWRINSVKDLHRELLVGQPMNDFVMDYLVKVAGWKLA